MPPSATSDRLCVAVEHYDPLRELERDGEVFTGRTAGILNMREGKVARLDAWLRERGASPAVLADAVFYSDSANDLPLLRRVGRAVAIDPDARLRAAAEAAGWTIVALPRGSTAPETGGPASG